MIEITLSVYGLLFRSQLIVKGYYKKRRGSRLVEVKITTLVPKMALSCLDTAQPMLLFGANKHDTESDYDRYTPFRDSVKTGSLGPFPVLIQMEEGIDTFCVCSGGPQHDGTSGTPGKAHFPPAKSFLLYLLDLFLNFFERNLTILFHSQERGLASLGMRAIRLMCK